jgi:hypothetical protein
MGFVRSGDEPAANERVGHGASRGMSDTWTGLERLVRPWQALRGRKTCETLSIGDAGGLRPEGGVNRVEMASRPGPRRCGVLSAPVRVLIWWIQIQLMRISQMPVGKSRGAGSNFGGVAGPRNWKLTN